MPLTNSSGRGVSLAALTSSLLLGAIPHGVAELLALLDGGGLELGAHHVAHGLDPVGDDDPLLAVPLLDQRLTVALVVRAGHPERPRQPLHAELLEALFGEVQVLHAPADLLPSERL